MSGPESRSFESQGLRLHYADWGNENSPLMLLVHGGRDHCRSWDRIALSLQPHFHVVAPDLRGHGDSDWTRGGSYSLTEYVYDLSRLVRHAAAHQVTIVGHSMGGMVGLIYAGTFPDQVSALVVLDGVTVLPNAKQLPAHERISKWVSQLVDLEDREPRRYRTIEEAAAQMRAHNKRLPPELALHLATFGVRRNADDTYSWKFDPYQRARAPHRLSPEDHVSLWSRITCPKPAALPTNSASLDRPFELSRSRRRRPVSAPIPSRFEPQLRDCINFPVAGRQCLERDPLS